MAAYIITYIVLLCVKCIIGEISLNIGNGDTSDLYLMTCNSSYCSNTTIFTFTAEKTCHNPLLTLHFRLTDFANSKLQYLTITLNQQELGKCTGPNNATYHANYNISSIPLYTDCLNDFSIAELVGYNPNKITLKISLSPHVSNTQRSYDNNLLYALVAFGCSDKQSNQITSQQWNPSSPVPAHSNLQCIQSGCQASAHFSVLDPEKCRVPLLSLQFWLTDFDEEYEYLTVEVNRQYLGICEGGKQMEINPNLLTNDQRDTYWNTFNYLCFRNIDISRYTGIQPEEIEIRLSLQETVDRHYLDTNASPTPYLLDAMVEIQCGEQTQDETVSSLMIYDRKSTSAHYPKYAHEISIKCQEVECGAMWQWQVLGHCPYPILSLFYFTQHYEDSMLEIRVNERIFGHCGPTSDTGGNITLNTQYGIENVRTCFEGLELHELLGTAWNSRADFNGNMDAISNMFQFGFALTEIDELDGIVNGSVAHLFINLNCKTETEIKDNELVHVNDDKVDHGGYPFATSALNCVYAGCSSKVSFILDVSFVECEVPKLDLWFYLTDFGIRNEFLSVFINNHLYGWCDGGADHVLNELYQCLYHADVEEWADWDVNGNQLQLLINASSYVDGLDANKNGFLVNAIAKLTCYDGQHDDKINTVDIYPNDEQLKQQIISIECQGVGCYTYSLFYIRENICYQPQLTVKFWLSDFLTFDEYVQVDINGIEVQKCRGGADQNFDTIWTCFEGKDIRYMLEDYEYNSDDDIDEYFIAVNDVLNVSLQMSLDSLWLDHGKNNSILQGKIILTCEADNAVHEVMDISDSDNTTFRFVELSVNIQKVSSDIILTYSDELQSRFEYSLDATIHFEDVEKKDGTRNERIAFTLQYTIDVIDAKQVSDFNMYISTLSHEDAKEIKRIVEMDIFLFIFQETLRDSHFKDSVLESISNIKIISDLPQLKPSISPSNIPTTTTTTTINTNEHQNKKDETKNENFLVVLFRSASATDWLSFLGVLVLLILICAGCIGGIGCICVYQQRNKTRKEIKKYKQTTNVDSSDSDIAIDELQGMMNDFDDNTPNKHKHDSISERIKMVNRANNLKDNVKRHHSHSGLHSDKINKKNNNKNSIKHKYSNLSNSNQNNNENEIEMCDIALPVIQSPSKSTAIHPALSTAIDTVNKINNLKSQQMAATQELVDNLVVSSAIIEASSEESESLPSGIDLSQEFVTIDDDIDVTIDINDIDDMNEIKRRKQHKRNKSKNKNKNKKFKNKKYSSIDMDDDNELSISDHRHFRGEKVFGMQIVSEDKEKDKFDLKNNKNKRLKMQKSVTSEDLSDDLSDLSDSGKQSLNSLTQDFSQFI